MRVRPGWITLILCLLLAPAWAQVNNVTVEVRPEDIGVGGVMRPGSWAPLRLTMANHSSEPRRVICQWLLSDADGDQVVSQRPVSLTAGQAEIGAFLYGMPPLATDTRTQWQVRLVDPVTSQMLASTNIIPGALAEPTERAIGVTDQLLPGLEPYTTEWTQHEACKFITNLDPTKLPDRWYGLSMLQALIWTPAGGDPGSVNFATLQAVRDWVHRGGHLVVILPAAGDLWSKGPLADLLPAVHIKTVTLDDQDILELLGSRPTKVMSMEAKEFVLDSNAGGNVAVLRLDAQKRAMIVAGQSGFGRVTLVGFDLTSPPLSDAHLPMGKFNLWNDIFGWQGPALLEQAIQSQMAENPPALWDPKMRGIRGSRINLGDFIPGTINMTGVAGTTLLVAIVIFGIYWLAAGPLGFAMLKRRKLTRHAWLTFVGVVLAFTLVTWTGAAVARDRRSRLEHFTVLDIDAATGMARAHSWLSLFVPTHGRIDVSLDPHQTAENVNTLATPGFRSETDDRAFLDPQRYDLDAGAPAKVTVPMRSTAKQFEAEWMGPIPGPNRGMSAAWVPPQVDGDGLRLKQGPSDLLGRATWPKAWPEGVVRHGLPGAIRDPLVVFCPGDGAMPWVWRHDQKTWEPGKPLTITPPDPARTDPLVVRPLDYIKRDWMREGYLGVRLKDALGWTQSGPIATAPDRFAMLYRIELMSFYGMLPPPVFMRDAEQGNTFGGYPGVMLERALGRSLDLTPLLATRRVIILGQLESGPLPMPLKVDGRDVAAEGWTVVRWIGEVKE